jgi:hypothetical protein
MTRALGVTREYCPTRGSHEDLPNRSRLLANDIAMRRIVRTRRPLYLLTVFVHDFSLEFCDPMARCATFKDVSDRSIMPTERVR